MGSVQMSGQADVDDVHIGLLDQLHAGGIDLSAGQVSQLLCKIGAHVSNSGHLDAFAFQSLVAGSVHAAHKAAADQTNFNHN